MANILVGIDGSERGERALEWAAYYAERESTQTNSSSRLTLLTVFSSSKSQAGLSEDFMRNAVEALLGRVSAELKAKHPSLDVTCRIAKGSVIDCIAEVSNEYDMVVLGTHHGRTVGQTISGARGLRVALAVKIPTVVVPVDWNVQEEKNGIVVGVGLDTESSCAVSFAAQQAALHKKPLRLVTAWGLPTFLNKPAEVMGGGIAPVGEQAQQRLDSCVEKIHAEYEHLEVSAEAIEGSSPTRVLIDQSKEAEVLVLGTHSFTALGRTLFGSVVHSVLLNLVVPTVVVPKK